MPELLLSLIPGQHHNFHSTSIIIVNHILVHPFRSATTLLLIFYTIQFRSNGSFCESNFAINERQLQLMQ